MSRSCGGKSPKHQSRAEWALNDLCVKLGYCLPPDEHEAILSNPPPDAEAFVDSVLIAEGRSPDALRRAERRRMIEIVDKQAVYREPRDHAISDLPSFPTKD